MEIDETLPEVVKSFLRKGALLEEIRLDETGQWTHEGLAFENPRIIQLFNRSIGRTEGGTWVLEIGQFTYPIEVDDAAYFVERISFAGAEPRLFLSDGTDEALVPTSLRYEDEGRLYCRVKNDRWDARFKRSAYYALAEHIEGEDTWVLVLGERRYTIG